jgi:4'-phosphopantetheinyl transferase
LGVDGIGDLEGLRAGDVHVWYVPLDVDGGAVLQHAASLSEDERLRAARFKFARDARHFVVARSALRSLLGEYLSMPPRRLEFAYGEHGKPAFEGTHAVLGFNISHSGEMAVVAVGWSRALGVDVERMRPLPDLADLAARSFAPRELSALGALPETDRLGAFFRCWTRKEAFIKATGQGLAQRLDAFAVSLAADEPARFLDIDGDRDALARWTLHDLAPPVGYAGALAAEGIVRTVQARTWSATGT